MTANHKVLILSSPDDAHASAVSAKLDELKVSYDFFRFDSFLQESTISFQLGVSKPTCSLQLNTGKLDFNSYLSIWHRRPGKIKTGSFIEPWINQMVEHESRSALDGMLRSVSCLWVNFPPNDHACLQKLWQLKIAQQVGLSIPETLVTNNEELVKEFFERCEGQVVYKMISEATNFSIPAYETPSGIATLPLRIDDLPFLKQVKHSPHLFQRSIKKTFELRATVVGKKIFCIKIDSQAGEGKIDWRHDYTVAMDPFELPDDIAANCLELMRRLGLNYGAIDLIHSQSGEYIFIEINCAGQYLFAEERAKLPISMEMAKLLAGQSEPIIARPC